MDGWGLSREWWRMAKPMTAHVSVQVAEGPYVLLPQEREGSESVPYLPLPALIRRSASSSARRLSAPRPTFRMACLSLPPSKTSARCRSSADGSHGTRQSWLTASQANQRLAQMTHSRSTRNTVVLLLMYHEKPALAFWNVNRVFSATDNSFRSGRDTIKRRVRTRMLLYEQVIISLKRGRRVQAVLTLVRLAQDDAAARAPWRPRYRRGVRGRLFFFATAPGNKEGSCC